MRKKMRKSILPTLLVFILSVIIVSVGTASLTPNSTTTVYLDPPTINGTAIGVGNTITVNINIRDVLNVSMWQAGLTFNPDVLECTSFKEGTFLKNVGLTLWSPGTIDNTAGVITRHACNFLGVYKASGDGQLAYLTFKVKATGISDLHLRDVGVAETVWDPIFKKYVPKAVPFNIIDVYTAIVDTVPHTVVTVSNSTGKTAKYGSGFYDHAFSQTLEELSFSVTGPYPAFSDITIPKTLLWTDNLDRWKVMIDGLLLSTEERTVTENGSHTFIYFTYTAGIHEVLITTRWSSAISIALSSTSITLESNVTISGNITADDPINPLRPNVTVTIQSRPIGAITWDTIDTVKTDSNSSYTYTWTPKTGGTHEVMTSWEGDEETIGYKSDVLVLIVLYVFEPEGVYIETNSTVADFNSIPALAFSQPLKQISFNVTSPYGVVGYSNVTIPKTLLPPPEPPIEWKVLINGTLLSTEERTVTENNNTSIYFTYSRGVNEIQITTRMNSTISMLLSSDSIDLGSSVTISGNITAEDHTTRPNVNVTISYRLRNVVTWGTLDTVETDENGNYTYPWTPETAGIYEVMASWEGDENTTGDKSDVLTLTVIQSSTISIALSSTNITFGSSVTINGAIDPPKPNMSVYIRYKLSVEPFFHTAPGHGQTDQNGEYTYTWTPTEPGTYEVRAAWLGDETTHNATSNVLTLAAKWTSTISIALSSTEISQGKSVTLSGNVTAADQTARPTVTVTILYRLSGETDWTTLETVTTDSNGNYSYAWTPETTGTYEVMASWKGDEETLGHESDVQTLTVKGAAGIPLEIVVAAVVAIIIIAAILVYFVKFRKPR